MHQARLVDWKHSAWSTITSNKQLKCPSVQNVLRREWEGQGAFLFVSKKRSGWEKGLRGRYKRSRGRWKRLVTNSEGLFAFILGSHGHSLRAQQASLGRAESWQASFILKTP